MPEPTSQHARTVKKRKTSEPHYPKDDYDSSFASGYYDSSDGFGFLGRKLYEQAKKNLNINGKGWPETKKSEANIVAETHQKKEGPALKYPINSSLRECMESILGELREAREKLLLWMRQEMRAVSVTNGVNGGAHIDAEKRKGQVDHGLNIGSTGMQSGPQGGQISEGNKGFGKRQGHGKPESCKPLDAVNGHDGYMHRWASRGIIHKGSGLVSSEPKNGAFNMAIKSGLGAESKDVNGLDQGLQSNVNGGKAELGQTKICSSSHNTMVKLPTESKSVPFDMFFRAGLGEDTKDADGMGGSLQSGANSREGFEFSKASPDIQKSLDRLPAETKSAFFDMGFEDEESNEGNGLGCSLESAASSKENSEFSRASNGIHNGFGGAFDTGCPAGLGEQSTEGPGLDGGLESAADGADVFGFSRVKNEVQRGLGVVSAETKHAVFDKGLTANTRGPKLDIESKQVDSLGGLDMAQAEFRGHHVRHNKSHIGAGISAQRSQPGDTHQQSSISGRFGCGVKRTYGSAMTFKGSALESGNDGMNASLENLSSTEVFNSATSVTGVVKVLGNPSGLPAADKDKVGSLGLHNQSGTLGMPSSAPTWNMLPTTKNAISPPVHDSKVVHLEYASRSKLGDAISGSGRTVNFTGFDSPFGYAKQSKSGNAMLGAYQGRASTSPVYFSSLCTNNSDFLSFSNGVMGMQLPPPPMQSVPPSSSSSMPPMLMGMPGHIAAQQDPSSMQTFLGLGMNGLSTAAKEMQVFPRLYLQGNPQHSQTSSKQVPSSTSPMVSHQRSPAVQERGILELNF